MAEPSALDQIIVAPGTCSAKRGRKPLNGVRAMTSAERTRRYRQLRALNKPKRALPPTPKFARASLTAQIAKDSFVRRLIDASFPHLAVISRACNKRLRELGLGTVPPVHEYRVVAMLVGTAIDYRIRAYFSRQVHRSPVVELGAGFFCKFSKKERQLNCFINSFDTFLAATKPEGRQLDPPTEEQLCRYCIVLAYLDFIGRSPFGSSAIEVLTSIMNRDPKKTLATIDSKITADLILLSKQFYEQHIRTVLKAKNVQIGRTLAGSADIGGADFDLLVDGCLIDLKATRRATISTQHLRQLVGYWLLDYNDAFKIRRVAVSLLRHGHTEYFDIERDLLPVASASELRRAFRRKLRSAAQNNQPAGFKTSNAS